MVGATAKLLAQAVSAASNADAGTVLELVALAALFGLVFWRLRRGGG